MNAVDDLINSFWPFIICFIVSALTCETQNINNRYFVYFLLVHPDAKLTPEQASLLRDALTMKKEKLQRLTTDHRDLHGAVSKIGKTIDRNFVSDFSSTTRNDVLVHEQNIQLLNKVIAQHLQRNNLDDVAATLIKESNLPAEEIVSDPFSDLHRIWESIYRGDLHEALEWATANSDKLQTRNSSLEFKLHRIAFLQVYILILYTNIIILIIYYYVLYIFGKQKLDAENGGGSPIEAIGYARKHFSKFVDKFEKEIQLLMGTLMYIPVGLENSPYRSLSGTNLLIEVKHKKKHCLLKFNYYLFINGIGR